jgi:sugar transferase (PEP-CTERM/EpsH1 system associated)
LRILFIAPYVPSPLRPRPLHLIRCLAARGHRIDLVAAATSAREHDDARGIARHCGRVRVVPVSPAQALASCVRGLFGGAPLQARYCFTPAMRAAVDEALAAGGAGYDLVHIEHLRAALHAGTGALPQVYDAVDCMSRLLEQTAHAAPRRIARLLARVELRRTRRFEGRLTRTVDRVLVTTPAEREGLMALPDGVAMAGRIRVLGNGVDAQSFAPTGERRTPDTIVFVGRMQYHANHAAAHALLTAIMPRVWAARPDARVRIVGADPPRALRTLARKANGRVDVTGYVDDVRPELARAAVSVNPMRYGVGVQNKVLEAMAMAVPVVATPAACAPFGIVPDVHALIAADADGLAAAILRVLGDPALAERLGAAGRAYVVAHHDWQVVARELEAVYRRVLASDAAADAPMGVTA